MTLHLRYKSYGDFDGAWTTVDSSYMLHSFKLRFADSSPATLSFESHKPQHEVPIPGLAFVQFYDDEGTLPDGVTDQSFTDPIFEGYVEEITPGKDSVGVLYVAYDPTFRVSKELTVMSLGWNNQDIAAGLKPTPATGGVPRVVFNSKIDRDDDYAYERTHDSTIGQILRALFDDQYPYLYFLHAAPGDGTDSGGETAYLLTSTIPVDLDLLTTRPQEKFVVTNETLRATLMRALTFEPQARFGWRPGSRLWRFYNILESGVRDITLNDASASDLVLSMTLTRSLESRYTAVRYVGPERVELTEVTALGGGLTDISDGPVLEDQGGVYVTGKNRWQITNPAKRRMSRILPQYIFVPVRNDNWGNPTDGFYTVAQYFDMVNSVSFQVRFPETKAGDSNWIAVNGFWLDTLNGIIDFRDMYVYRYNSDPAPSGGLATAHVENPYDVKLIYGSYIEAFDARYPVTEGTFEGSAFDDFNVQTELVTYDEMLAVGYELGVPVTTAIRLNAFATLAEKVHSQVKDTVYTGGLTLAGRRYDYAWLDRRINLKAVDADGVDLITGWENLGAPVTEVEFDYEEDITTLSINSDKAELVQINMDQLRYDLKIRAAVPMFTYNISAFFETKTKFTEWGTPVVGQDVYTTINMDFFYGDPETGEKL